MMSFCKTLLQNDPTSHCNIYCVVPASLRKSRPPGSDFSIVVLLDSVEMRMQPAVNVGLFLFI